MSKIEEALRKAKHNSKAGNGFSLVNNKIESTSTIRELVPSSKSSTLQLSKESSAKEIALMEDEENLDNDSMSELGIIYSDMADTRLANTYRDLRTKLIQRSNGNNFIVMITSCHPDADNADISLNLAAAFAFDKSKTSLLIDCNLHDKRLASRLNLNSSIGITDYLENSDINVESILHATGLKRVRMIPTGTYSESATEYFTSSRMKQLMADMLMRYSDRYIFINAAPVKEYADTRILIELCDYVILTVPYGMSTKNSIKSAAEAIGNDKLLGVIFNDIPKAPRFNFLRSRKQGHTN